MHEVTRIGENLKVSLYFVISPGLSFFVHTIHDKQNSLNFFFFVFCGVKR